jgi:hypothetical protein
MVKDANAAEKEKSAAPAADPASTEKPTPPSEAIPTPVLPRYVRDQGWAIIEAKNLPKVFYSVRKIGENFQAIRIEVLADGSVIAAAQEPNLKMIAIERTLDLMSQETI